MALITSRFLFFIVIKILDQKSYVCHIPIHVSVINIVVMFQTTKSIKIQLKIENNKKKNTKIDCRQSKIKNMCLTVDLFSFILEIVYKL